MRNDATDKTNYFLKTCLTGYKCKFDSSHCLLPVLVSIAAIFSHTPSAVWASATSNNISEDISQSISEEVRGVDHSFLGQNLDKAAPNAEGKKFEGSPITEAAEEREAAREAREQSDRETLLEGLENAKALLASAKESYANDEYVVAEEQLRQLVRLLVDPTFPLESNIRDQDPNTCGDDFFSGLCNVFVGLYRRVLAPAGTSFSNYWNTGPYGAQEESAQQEVIAAAVDAHKDAVEGIKLLQQVLIAQDKPGEALEIAEVGRTLEFNRIGPALIGLKAPGSVSTPERITIRTIKDIAQRLDSTLVYYSNVSPQVIYIWAITPDRELIFSEQVLPKSIEFQVDETLKLASSFTQRGPNDSGTIELLRDDELQLRSSSNNRPPVSVNRDEQVEALKALHEVLITPIQEELTESVIFLPQEKLYLVPFPALQSSENSLIDNHQISLAPSIRVLNNYRQLPVEMPKRFETLVVGDPDTSGVKLPSSEEDTGSLPRLKGTQVEAKHIAELLRTDPILDKNATERTIIEKASNAKIIHIAAHGILDSPNSLVVSDVGTIIEESSGNQELLDEAYDDELRRDRLQQSVDEATSNLLPGAIVLAASGEDDASTRNDGLLTAYEILDLQLNADLIVLSACNTAQGIPGDSSILGIPYALSNVGVARAVVSVWPVPDGATSRLMREFYLAMNENSNELNEYGKRTGNIDPDKALQIAMTKVKAIPKYRDPINWAGFTIIELGGTPGQSDPVSPIEKK